jgi:hypothetical protein
MIYECGVVSALAALHPLRHAYGPLAVRRCVRIPASVAGVFARTAIQMIVTVNSEQGVLASRLGKRYEHCSEDRAVCPSPDLSTVNEPSSPVGLWADRGTTDR